MSTENKNQITKKTMMYFSCQERKKIKINNHYTTTHAISFEKEDDCAFSKMMND